MPPKSISQMKLNSQVGSSCGIIESFQIEPVSVQFTCSVVSITKSWSLLRLMPIESVMPSNHLILCHPLLLPSIFPSIRVFSNEMFFIWWPKYWSFSFSISPSNEYSGLISFRIAWFDLPAVQGILKSLVQHHGSKASILRRSAFFIVTLTSIHDYWKNHSFD